MFVNDNEALALAKDFCASVVAWRLANGPSCDANIIMLNDRPRKSQIPQAIIALLALANAILISIFLAPSFAGI